MLIAALLLMNSCSNEELSNESTRENIAPVTLRLCSPSANVTRTWLDTSIDGMSYPVYWSNGDKVSVNGESSLPLSVADGQKVTEADFLFTTISAPYTILYPASAWAGVNDEGRIKITIPDSQEWKADTFSDGAALLYGMAENETERAELINLCGAVSLTLSDKHGKIIKSISVKSLSEDDPIAGDFILDTSEGKPELHPESNSSCHLNIVLPDEGVTLSPEGTSFIFTIPAGDYPDGFSIVIEDAETYIQRSYWLRQSAGADPGVTLHAGRIVEFEMMEYEAQAKEIRSADDWERFAHACNEAAGTDGWDSEWRFKDGICRLGADITAENLTCIENWRGHLDCCGHTITLTAAESPLFRTLSGVVENLTISGSNSCTDPAAYGASIFAGTIDGGLLSDCMNTADLNVTDWNGDMISGVFASDMRTGVIRGCTNEGVVNITSDISSSNNKVIVGGLVGTVQPEGTCIIEKCINNAEVNITFVKGTDDKQYPLYGGYGGIVGHVSTGTPESHLTIRKCSNNGDVTASYLNDSKVSTEMTSAVGGIIGSAICYDESGKFFSWWHRSKTAVLDDVFPDMDGLYMEMEDCINTGDIYSFFTASCSSDDPTKAYVGGVAGAVNGLKDAHAKISGCRNEGKVIPTYEGAYTRSGLSVVAGGMLGYGGYVDLSDCIVRSFQVGTLKKQIYSASGGIGLATLAFTMTGCEINANVQMIRSANYTEDNYSLGFTLSTKQNSKGGIRWPMIELEGSSVTGNSFGGSITYSAEIVKYNEADAAAYADTETLVVDESNFEGLIASPSFFADYDKKGFHTQVDISSNTFLNQ